MVISNSKVNLASRRLYREAFSQGDFSTSNGSRNRIYSFLGNSFSSAYTMAEEHSSHSGRGNKSSPGFDFYTAGSHEGFRSTGYYGVFAYSRNARLVTNTQQWGGSAVGDVNSTEANSTGIAANSANSTGSAANSINPTGNSTDSAKNVSAATGSFDNSKSIYDTARERIFISLMQIMHRLSFRGQFDDYYNYHFSSGAGNILNTSNTSNSTNVSNTTDALNEADVLSITNSSDASAWTIKQTYSTFYGEEEYTSFSGKGTVVTSNGQEISFDVNMEMSRSYMEQTEISYIQKFPKILTDPLIINLDCNPVDIQDKTFMFDLNCDGKKEEIAALAPGSGYLALDINGDGIINDGSELFGTSNGDGFKDLAAYDSDGNGWIDEADDIYKRLTVWTTNANGEPVLMSLKEADVGAIYLGNSKTQFDLKDNDNNLKGRVRSSGIYLHENGTAGTVQQVDF